MRWGFTDCFPGEGDSEANFWWATGLPYALVAKRILVG